MNDTELTVDEVKLLRQSWQNLLEEGRFSSADDKQLAINLIKDLTKFLNLIGIKE